MKKYTLSKSDSSEIIDTLNEKWPKPALPHKLKSIQMVELEPGHALLFEDDFAAVKIDQDILPLLAKEEMLEDFPSVSVDMGAVKFVCNGANVMRPGIVNMDEFEKDDIVVVKDGKHGKFLAAGIALVPSSKARAASKGAIVKNLHFVSDKFWKTYKEGI